MLAQHDESALSVVAALFAGERAIDVALADLSRLPGSIAAARIAAQLPFGTGQGALSDAAEALALMVRARHHMARAHDRLREAGEEIGLDVTAFGDVFPCPTSAAADPGVEGPLRLVA